MRMLTNHKLVILFILSFSLQSCAINDKKQLSAIIESSQSVIKTLTKKPLTQKDIAAGLKEALRVGAERVVSRVGRQNGYLKDKAIHIVLPKKLQKVHKTLDRLGLGQYTKELEVKMNHAAEMAAPQAKAIFYTAIKTMKWDDVKTIYNGSQDAATKYFKRKMTPPLQKMMKPIVEKTLAEAGVVKAYRHAVKQYHTIPFVPRVKSDLTDYVMNKGINGMFYYLAKEEAEIRRNPEKRTTEILRRVFSGTQ